MISNKKVIRPEARNYVPTASAYGRDADHRLDALYEAFEDVFRGSRDDIKARMQPYLDRLVPAGAGQPGKPILDIGCGRGEWLEILKECHLQAYGIDCNVMMIERAKSLGLDAQEADLVTHLRSLPMQAAVRSRRFMLSSILDSKCWLILSMRRCGYLCPAAC